MGEGERWEPLDPEDFRPDQRLTVVHLNSFHAALDAGRIPDANWRGSSPDYENDQVLLRIWPDDAAFRSSVAAALPPGSYRIVVENVFGATSR